MVAVGHEVPQRDHQQRQHGRHRDAEDQRDRETVHNRVGIQRAIFSNRMLWLSLCAAFLLQMLATQWGPATRLFGITGMAWADWGVSRWRCLVGPAAPGSTQTGAARLAPLMQGFSLKPRWVARPITAMRWSNSAATSPARLCRPCRVGHGRNQRDLSSRSSQPPVPASRPKLETFIPPWRSFCG